MTCAEAPRMGLSSASADMLRRSCAVELHNPAGWETRHNRTMKTVDNRSATAPPRGGVESSVLGTRPTATRVNTIRRWAWASLRANGEAGSPAKFRRAAHGPSHGGPCAMPSVVGGSRSGRGGASEDGRSAGAGSRKRFPAEVSAAIRAKKRGNARGAKGGRKVERPRP